MRNLNPSSKWSMASLAGIATLVLALWAPQTSLAVAPEDAERLGADVQVRPAPEERGSFLVRGTGQAEPLPPEEARLLKLTAVQLGVDAEELLVSYAGESAFSQLTTSLEASIPQFFVIAGMARPGEDSNYWIRFTEIPGQGVLDQIKRLPVDVTVKYGSSASVEELNRLEEELIAGVEEHRDVLLQAGTPYDAEQDVTTLGRTLTRMRLNSWFACALASVMLMACSPGDDAPRESESPKSSPGGSADTLPTLLTTAHMGDVRMEALIVGKLKVNGAGCFVIGNRTLVAPDGSTVTGGGQAIQIPGLARFEVGDEVRSAGGFPTLADVESVAGGTVASCQIEGSAPEVAVLNPAP